MPISAEHEIIFPHLATTAHRAAHRQRATASLEIVRPRDQQVVPVYLPVGMKEEAAN